jgi:hypothetical protein
MANQKTSNSLLVRETKQLFPDEMHYMTLTHYEDGSINFQVTTLEDELVQEMSMDHRYASFLYEHLGRFWEDMSPAS